MDFLLNLLLALIVLLHLGFLVLEIFLWNTTMGRKIFHLTVEDAQTTRKLAMNQGLYNGFLAAGCLWALVSGSFAVQLFFISCVFIAGMFGTLTVSRRIFWIQGLPAMLALIILVR
jgi:putative membrane protein